MAIVNIIEGRNSSDSLEYYEFLSEYLSLYPDQDSQTREFEKIQQIAEATDKIKELYPSAKKDGFGFDPETNEPIFPEGYTQAYKILKEAGFLSINASKEAGGSDISYPGLYQVMNNAFDAFAPLALGLMVTQSDLAMARDSQLLEEKGENQKWKINAYKLIEKKIAAGEMTGVMALTEQHGGSNLANGDMKCQIWKMPDGTVKVHGNKHYITGVNGNAMIALVGHECNEEGVPQYHDEERKKPKICTSYVPLKKMNFKTMEPIDGSRNNITRSEPLWKDGMQPQDLAVITFDGAKGIYAGEGFTHMLGVMNPARVKIAIQGTTHTSQAYEVSLQYACEKGLSASNTPIVERDQVMFDVKEAGAYHYLQKALIMRVGKLQEEFKHKNKSREMDTDDVTLEKALNFGLIPLLKSSCTEQGVRQLQKAKDITASEGFTNPDLHQMIMDAAPATFYEGTNNMQNRTVIARGLKYQKSFKDSAYSDQINGLEEKYDKLTSLAANYSEANPGKDFPFYREAVDVVSHYYLAHEAISLMSHIDKKLEGGLDPNSSKYKELKTIHMHCDYFLENVIPEKFMGKVDAIEHKLDPKRLEKAREKTPVMKDLIAKNREDLKTKAGKQNVGIGSVERNPNLIAHDLKQL